MALALICGTFHEKESRKLTQRTGYAADWIEHESIPGDYPVYIHFDYGFTIPMPSTIGFAVKTRIVDGELFSGFGGVNYHVRKVEPSDSEYTFIPSTSAIQNMVREGRLTLLPEFAWLDRDHASIIAYVKDHQMTWEHLRGYASR